MFFKNIRARCIEFTHFSIVLCTKVHYFRGNDLIKAVETFLLLKLKATKRCLLNDKSSVQTERGKGSIPHILTHKNEPKIANKDFIGGFVVDIFDLDSPELMPYVKRLYDAGLVIKGMAGSWAEYLEDFNDPTFDKEPHFQLQNMAAYYAEMREIVVRNAENAKKLQASKGQSKLGGIFKTPPKALFQPKKASVQPTMDIKKLMQNKSTPRNASCLCGSGRKFKNCHGK
jgi:hypothetical protein